ncbi:MAG: hypothetical protein K6E75_06605 [Lachnospiraceae bacterium]|nr:hypothetical protein [Lachnospiraceae bacterium]
MAKKDNGVNPNQKVSLRKKKKSIIPTVVISCILLAFLVGVALAVGKMLMQSYIDERYPKGQLQPSLLSTNAKQMEAPAYKDLYEIAKTLNEEGNGIYLYPENHRTSFVFTSDMYARLSIKDKDGIFLVCRGSGNAQSDICDHLNDFYHFLGKTTASYDEKVAETGTLDGYTAMYSAGYLESGNFFKKEGFYVSAFEVWPRENEIVLFAYASQKQEELSEMNSIMFAFASEMFKGGLPADEQDRVGDYGSQAPVTEVESPESEDVPFAGSVSYDNGTVTGVYEDGQLKPVDGHDSSITGEEEAISLETISDNSADG